MVELLAVLQVVSFAIYSSEAPSWSCQYCSSEHTSLHAHDFKDLAALRCPSYCSSTAIHVGEASQVGIIIPGPPIVILVPRAISHGCSMAAYRP